MPRDPVPERLVEKAEVYGIPEIRFWGDEKSAALDRSLKLRVSQSVATRLPSVRAEPVFDVKYLALSGGAGDGAYGAGLLCGWTTAGTRPEFEIVDTANVEPDPEIAAVVKGYQDKLDRELKVEIGTTTTPLDSRRATVRGGEAAIGNLIADVLDAPDDQAVLARVRGQVAELCAKFPVYGK